MKKDKLEIVKIVKYISIFLILMFFIFLYQACSPLWSYDFEFAYTSPEGTNTIIVKYDFFSRPDIFKKGFLRDKKIWEYPNSAFQETVTFGVEWLSENKIRFTYDDVNSEENDEEYIITIPD